MSKIYEIWLVWVKGLYKLPYFINQKSKKAKRKDKTQFFFSVLKSKRLTCGVKNSQELQRNFKLVTMFGFSAILMCSWESLLSSLSIVLTNGGTAGLIWTWALVWLGFTAVYLSMAEVRLFDSARNDSAFLTHSLWLMLMRMLMLDHSDGFDGSYYGR